MGVAARRLASALMVYECTRPLGQRLVDLQIALHWHSHDIEQPLQQSRLDFGLLRAVVCTSRMAGIDDLLSLDRLERSNEEVICVVHPLLSTAGEGELAKAHIRPDAARLGKMPID